MSVCEVAPTPSPSKMRIQDGEPPGVPFCPHPHPQTGQVGSSLIPFLYL